MSVDLVACRNFVASILNVTRGGYGNWSTKVDPLHPQDEIDAAVLAAARGIIAVIFDTPGHRLNAKMKELKTVTDGQIVPGPIADVFVDGIRGTKISPSKLRRFRLNVNNISAHANRGYYTHDKQSQVINFIGSSCTAESRKDPTPTDLLVPDEYDGWVKAGALFFAYTKQGTNTAAATIYGNIYDRGLQLIRDGKSVAPMITGREAD